MKEILSSISYFLPVTTLVIFIYFQLFMNINMLSIVYDFKFKFYLSIFLGLLSSIYIFINVDPTFVAIVFGIILTILLIQGFKHFNSNSYNLFKLKKNISIIELIYNLKLHSNEFTSKIIKKLRPLIDSIENKKLKDLINKKINNLQITASSE